MSEIEQTVRTRLRGLRTAQSLSLDDLAARSHLSPSTISRIETGKRAISLDVLLPLARALRTDVEMLLAEDIDEDVVIRPAPTHEDGRTTWMLTKATGTRAAMKVRLEPATTACARRRASSSSIAAAVPCSGCAVSVSTRSGSRTSSSPTCIRITPTASRRSCSRGWRGTPARSRRWIARSRLLRPVHGSSMP